MVALIDATIDKVLQGRDNGFGTTSTTPSQVERAQARRPPNGQIRAEAWRLLRRRSKAKRCGHRLGSGKRGRGAAARRAQRRQVFRAGSEEPDHARQADDYDQQQTPQEEKRQGEPAKSRDRTGSETSDSDDTDWD